MNQRVGYKGFNFDLTSNYGDFQFEIGGTYELDGVPKLCERGFHFCKELDDVFRFYPIKCNDQYRYCLIEFDPECTFHYDSEKKSVTKRIRIVRELSEEEIREKSRRVKVWRNEKKEFHREDMDSSGRLLPAVIVYREDGSVKKEGWWKGGKLHREDKDSSGKVLPAVIQYFRDGSVWWERWFCNGLQNREERDSNGRLLPVEIWYHEDGSVWREEWWKEEEEGSLLSYQ